MKLIAAIVSGFFFASCGGGSSSPSEIPQAQACDQASLAACAKLFMCNDTTLKLVQVAVGGTVAACQTYIKNNYCATLQCTAGQTYHGDKAKQCKDQFGTVACSTLVAAASSLSAAAVLGSVPACNQICTAGAADASGGG